MAALVINEWLWHDASGGNGPVAQQQAFAVIQRLASSQDQILVIGGSAFDRKAWACCNSPNQMARRLAAIFIDMIRQNSDRCRILSDVDAAPLPDALAAAIKPADQYLVRAQLTVDGAILITTDGPLREIVGKAGLPCLSREEFLKGLAV